VTDVMLVIVLVFGLAVLVLTIYAIISAMNDVGIPNPPPSLYHPD